MRISIFTPKQTIWQGRARQAVLPCEDGQICVLDFHQPFLVSLSKGDIRYIAQEKNVILNKQISIKDGVARMRRNELSILIET